jgi:hypothetical protein
MGWNNHKPPSFFSFTFLLYTDIQCMKISNSVRLLPVLLVEQNLYDDQMSSTVQGREYELFLQDQAFPPSCDLAPHPPSPTSHVSNLDRRHTGRLRKRGNLLMGGGRSQIIWRRESLDLYKSFNTFQYKACESEKSLWCSWRIESQESKFYKSVKALFNTRKSIYEYEYIFVHVDRIFRFLIWNLTSWCSYVVIP